MTTLMVTSAVRAALQAPTSEPPAEPVLLIGCQKVGLGGDGLAVILLVAVVALSLMGKLPLTPSAQWICAGVALGLVGLDLVTLLGIALKYQKEVHTYNPSSLPPDNSEQVTSNNSEQELKELKERFTELQQQQLLDPPRPQGDNLLREKKQEVKKLKKNLDEVNAKNNSLLLQLQQLTTLNTSSAELNHTLSKETDTLNQQMTQVKLELKEAQEKLRLVETQLALRQATTDEEKEKLLKEQIESLQKEHVRALEKEQESHEKTQRISIEDNCLLQLELQQTKESLNLSIKKLEEERDAIAQKLYTFEQKVAQLDEQTRLLETQLARFKQADPSPLLNQPPPPPPVISSPMSCPPGPPPPLPSMEFMKPRVYKLNLSKRNSQSGEGSIDSQSSLKSDFKEAIKEGVKAYKQKNVKLNPDLDRAKKLREKKFFEAMEIKVSVTAYVNIHNFNLQEAQTKLNADELENLKTSVNTLNQHYTTIIQGDLKNSKEEEDDLTRLKADCENFRSSFEPLLKTHGQKIFSKARTSGEENFMRKQTRRTHVMLASEITLTTGKVSLYNYNHNAAKNISELNNLTKEIQEFKEQCDMILKGPLKDINEESKEIAALEKSRSVIKENFENLLSAYSDTVFAKSSSKN